MKACWEIEKLIIIQVFARIQKIRMTDTAKCLKQPKTFLHYLEIISQGSN